ncbi:hypothetical protein G4B88_022544 [Cannabis sativa]|uniref:Uncharacterized protein n=1 Tax=Cannabis sativa TaxID=3483 RepID=A0A7J6HXC8_CANSA|nr:hypothetical protein G4B88_022544 [Cannabis sativa]
MFIIEPLRHFFWVPPLNLTRLRVFPFSHPVFDANGQDYNVSLVILFAYAHGLTFATLAATLSHVK